jgi:hypothetical protein
MTRTVVITKLALLPGMGGTGELFEAFLSHFDGDYIAIPLPQLGSQDHTFEYYHVNFDIPCKEYVRN